MRRRMIILVAVALIPLGAADKPTPRQALEALGLKLVGGEFVVKEEAEFHRAFLATRTAHAKMLSVVQRKSAIEDVVRSADLRFDQLNQQRRLLSSRLEQTAAPEERAILSSRIELLGQEIGALESELANPGLRQGPGAKLARSREDFVDAIIDARLKRNAADKHYKRITADGSAQKLLDELNGPRREGQRPRYVLGPGKTFIADTNALENLGREVVSVSVTVESRGKNSWIDVAFDGKTRRLIYSPAEPTVVLPAELADELGLKPGPGDEVEKYRRPDGTLVDATRIKIPTLSIDSLKLTQVDAVILPRGLAGVEPRLGQSALNSFMIRQEGDPPHSLLLTTVKFDETGSGSAAKAAAGSSVKKGATKPSKARKK